MSSTSRKTTSQRRLHWLHPPLLRVHFRRPLPPCPSTLQITENNWADVPHHVRQNLANHAVSLGNPTILQPVAPGPSSLSASQHADTGNPTTLQHVAPRPSSSSSSQHADTGTSTTLRPLSPRSSSSSVAPYTPSSSLPAKVDFEDRCRQHQREQQRLQDLTQLHNEQAGASRDKLEETNKAPKEEAALFAPRSGPRQLTPSSPPFMSENLDTFVNKTNDLLFEPPPSSIHHGRSLQSSTSLLPHRARR